MIPLTELAPSLTENVAPVEAGAHVVGGRLARRHRRRFALGDGARACSRRTARRTASRRIPDGAILVAAERRRAPRHRRRRRPRRGDRPRTARRASSPTTERRLDRCAGAPARRRLAWSAGKTRARPRRQGPREDASRRPPRCAASPSRRRAIGSPSATTTACRSGSRTPRPSPKPLEWKGSHLDVDLVAGRALRRHLDAGERAAWLAPRPDKGHMRMTGYPGQDALAGPGRMTACGSRPQRRRRRDRLALRTKEGPTGKAPRECGVRPAKVTRVAFHPKALRARDRLRGRLHPAGPPDRRLRAPGAAGRRRAAASRRSPGTAPASASPSAPRTAQAGVLTLPG